MIIIAVKPTSSLNSKTSKEIINISHKSEGKTVVMVTHNREYQKCANKIIELSDGKIIKKEILGLPTVL